MFFKFFRKPAWENADDNLRAEAVAQSQDLQLMDKLSDFARHDTAASVRRAAIKRLSDPSLLFDRARLDTDADVRAGADTRLQQLLSQADSPVDRATRERFLHSGADAPLLERVAVDGYDAALRKVALARISRAAFLQDRLIKESDSDLKQYLLDRLEDPAILNKVADQARKTDKTISRLAREKAQSLLIKARDPKAIREHATQLCDEFAKRIHAPTSVNRAEWDALRAQWDALHSHIDADLIRRAEGYFRAVDAKAMPPEAKLVATTVEGSAQSSNHSQLSASDHAGDKAVTSPAAPIAIQHADAALQQLAVRLQSQSEHLSPTALQKLDEQFQARLSKLSSTHVDDDKCAREFNALVKSIGARHQKAEEEKRQLHAAQVHALKGLEHALAEGQLNESQKAKQALDALLHGKLDDASLKRRIDAAEEALNKLQHWARWSNNKQRIRICDELQAAIDAKLHPDAIANKVKTLQAEWAKLEAIENEAQINKARPESRRHPSSESSAIVSPDSGGNESVDARNEAGRVDASAAAAPKAKVDGLTRRFRALCFHALAPAKSYFEKRKSIQSDKRSDLEQSVLEAEQMLDAEASLAKLFDAKSKLRECQRRVDEIEPAKRGEYGKRIRQLIESIQAKIESTQTQAADAKRAVIAQLKRQLARARGNESVSLAKQAQQQWKTLGRSDRKTDDALWEEFKALLDPVFNEARVEKESLDQAERDKRAQAQACIDEMLALSNADDLHDNDTRVVAIEQRWRDLDVEDRGMQKQFASARDGIDRAMQARRQKAEQDSWTSILRAEQNLYSATQSDKPQNDLFAVTSNAQMDFSNVPTDINNALAACQNTARSSLPSDIEAAQQFVIQLETLVGITSPPEFAEAQRQYRMQQLAEKMGRDSARNVSLTPLQWYAAWLRVGHLDASVRAPLQARVAAAMSQLLAGIQFKV